MPKYRHLRSAAHNFGHSFVSLMNWEDGDYVLNHVVHAMRASGNTELHLDVLSGSSDPAALRIAPVLESVRRYQRFFTILVKSHGVPAQHVRDARLTLRFAFDSTRVRDAKYLETPLECVVEITDDRGRGHVGRVTDTWSYVA